MKKLRLPALAGAVSVTVLFLLGNSPALGRDDGHLRVSFFDVGQGDSIFIESPSGTQVLVDGGKGTDVLRGLGEAMGYFDRDIDMVVATHPDLDHVGGLVDVLERYEVHTILMTENEGDASAWAAFKERALEEGAAIMYARRGQVYDLGGGTRGSTTITVLFPDRDPRGLESNTASIVAKLSYGETDVLLTGDSPESIESYLILAYGSGLQSEILKVGHHGSRTSTGEAFVERVRPTHAIISSGRDNPYGHPHEEVVELLASHSVVQKNTADEGSILLISDGDSYWFK